MNARFVHTNLIAQNWRALARFYERVFGCMRVPPERNLSGPWLEEGIGLPEARIQGIHLRLPGYGDGGPTLEIFEYNRFEERPGTAVNRPGYGHIAFAVDDVGTARDAVLAHGGGTLGEVVSLKVPSAGTVTFAYVTDPEGNIIELQHWKR